MRNIGLQKCIYFVRRGVLMWCLACISLPNRKELSWHSCCGFLCQGLGLGSLWLCFGAPKWTPLWATCVLFPNPVLVFALEIHGIKSEQKTAVAQVSGTKNNDHFFCSGFAFHTDTHAAQCECQSWPCWYTLVMYEKEDKVRGQG